MKPTEGAHCTEPVRGHVLRRLPALAGAAIVFVLGVGISLLASRALSQHLAREAEARFEARSVYMHALLEQRLDDFNNLILGLRGMFIASPRVSRDEFRRYTENLDLQRRLPGLQDLSYQRRIVHAEKSAFEARVRADRSLEARGNPEFAIRPEGTRPEYIVIDYIEPMEANRAAFGYDAATQPPDSEAIRLARDTGEVQITEPFAIVQSPNALPRVVLRAAVYRRGLPVATIGQRRAALDGFVVLALETRASFREFYKNMLMGGERLVIEDVGPAQGSGVARRTLVAETGSEAGPPRFSRRFAIEYGGRRWELQYGADATWLGSLPGQRHPDTVLAAGLVISLLLASLYLAMADARNRALRMAEEKTRVLRATQDNMAQGISVVDRDLRVIGHNRRFFELLGFPASLARENVDFVDFVRFNAERGEYGPGDIEELIHARMALARRFEPHRFKRTRPDGTVLEVVGTLLPDGGMVTTYTDITQQERDQEALRSSERRHRTLVEMSPDAIFAHRDGIVLFANPAAGRLFGAATPEQLAGQPVDRLVAPQDRPRVLQRIARLLSGEVAFMPLNEVIYLTLDGRPVEVESTGTLIELDGRPAILTVARDITERKLAAARVLRERDFRQHLIESIPGVFYLFDAEGRFHLWNRNFEQVAGYTAEAMARAHPLDFFDGPDMERIAEGIGAVFSGGSATVEAPFRSRDGTKRPYIFTGERVTLEDGRPGLVGVGLDISDRKRTEEALARQTAILQATLEAMDQGISVVDTDLHMTSLNKRFCELLDFPEEMAAAGADFADFARLNAERGEYGPCNVDELVASMVERARHPSPHRFRRTRPNGRIIEVRGNPMPGGGFVTTYTDVTEQEHAENALRLSEKRYRNLIDLSPDAIFVHRKHVILIANPAAARLWGLDSVEQAIGRNILDFIQPESRDLVKQRIARLESDPTQFRLPWVEQDYLRADGSIVPVEGSATVIELEDGPAILSVIRDISDRKKAENTLRRERDFRQKLIESVPGIFFLFDPSGRFLLWNRNLETVLGRDAREVAAMHSIEMYDEEDRAQVRAATRQAMETGAASVEASLVTRSGRRVPYIVTGLRIEIGDGLSFIGLGVDITERKLAEQVIRDLNDTLEQRVRERTAALEASNRELESFSYSVSHDLRAPLRALHGFSHLLEEEYAHRLDDNGLNYLQRIRSASQRMGDLIDDLINLARVSRLELKRREVDLSQIAAETAASLAEQSHGRHVDWRIAPGVKATADALLMRVVLENLLGNAWKFTEKTTEAVIEFGLASIGGTPSFYVRDNGAGFDAAYAGKLFQPFQRLHRPDEFSGSGIGLATVARIVRRHGGHIRAEGAPGKGATFFFTLA